MLCVFAFMDMIDGVIVTVAMPSIQKQMGFSQQGLQWVASGYLLTYGCGLLLGGRAADLFGRRRVLVTGVVLFGFASLIGGLAPTGGVLVAARIAQGVGAAAMTPAALSVVLTSFGSDRNRAIFYWSNTLGLATTAGVLLGGVLTETVGWRAVLLINPVICLLTLPGLRRLLPDDRRRASWRAVDVPGALLSTGGLGTLIWGVVEAPHAGWLSWGTVVRLVVGAALLVAFVLNERGNANALMPLAIFRVRGLAAANLTQAIAIAGLFAMFFLVTLYMQIVLKYSALQTGLAYLPATAGVLLGAGVATKVLIPRIGTRPVIVGGLLVASGGVLWLSFLPVRGAYAIDILPGFAGFSVGLGLVFVAVLSAATNGVAPDRAGLASALVNVATQVGGTLGVAGLSTVATSYTTHLLAAGASTPDAALTAGFNRALLASSIAIGVAALIGLRTYNTTKPEAAV